MNHLKTSCDHQEQHFGFIALIGPSNVGKSTLLNQLVGAKVSIVSSKEQTTRFRVRGIAVQNQYQAVFVDTPGIFNPRSRLDRSMIKAAWAEAGEADIIVLMVDVTKPIDDELKKVIEQLKNYKAPVFLMLNKVDMLGDKSQLLGLSQDLFDPSIFQEVFMVSALKNKGVDSFFQTLCQFLPQGHWMFPQEDISDLPLRLMAAEITREKLYHYLHQELPYAATVETDLWEEKPHKGVRIEQTIYVQKDSQKAIVLGKGGQRIKQLGAASRRELSDILEQDVHLFLFVKVREKWGDDPNRFSPWGLEYNV